jgi:ferredoxin
VPKDQQHMTKLNAELAKLPTWKSITKRKAPLPDADEWKDVTGKLPMLIR